MLIMTLTTTNSSSTRTQFIAINISTNQSYSFLFGFNVFKKPASSVIDSYRIWCHNITSNMLLPRIKHKFFSDNSSIRIWTWKLCQRRTPNI